ncbi:MAG TPA: TIGR00730 family Rossman fold protein [Blastocatellia bacterium]|nr:TIGR00730 family Rossman fold protein [Blastocatellia bacterium]
MSQVEIKRICVFCGSSPGRREAYQEQAQALARAMVARGIGLVYGGGGIGLMGTLAQAMIAAGGEVIGVIPYGLASKERALEADLEDRVETRVVKTMHERKAMMTTLADAFIAMPGGFGTFDELFEALTWAQLGIHRKPIGLLNVEGYFDPLISMIDRAIAERFVKPTYRRLIAQSNEIEALLEMLSDYQPVEAIVRWVEMDEA